MELTDFTDYSLRVLMFLAARPGKKSSIDELADFYGISRHHVAKITRSLAEGGWLETTRGKGGGVSLAKPAAEINLAEVVSHTEPHFHLVECFREQNQNCVLTHCCSLKSILYGARGQFFAYLRKHTLADAVQGFPSADPGERRSLSGT